MLNLMRDAGFCHLDRQYAIHEKDAGAHPALRLYVFPSFLGDQLLNSIDTKMKAFAFDLSKDPKPNTEIIPPPAMTRFTHPFNYAYVISHRQSVSQSRLLY